MLTLPGDREMTKIIDALQLELFVAEQLLWASMDAVEAQGRGGSHGNLQRRTPRRSDSCVSGLPPAIPMPQPTEEVPNSRDELDHGRQCCNECGRVGSSQSARALFGHSPLAEQTHERCYGLRRSRRAEYPLSDMTASKGRP